MTRNLFALLLLTAISLGLTAGPHPCRTPQGERESRQPSCHEAADPGKHTGARASVPADGSQGEQDGCSTVCRHACHMPAVAEVKPTTFAVVPLSLAVAETPDRTLPQFAHPIDHVPLT